MPASVKRKGRRGRTVGREAPYRISLGTGADARFCDGDEVFSDHRRSEENGETKERDMMV